jgi:hypothetical protein
MRVRLTTLLLVMASASFSQTGNLGPVTIDTAHTYEFKKNWRTPKELPKKDGIRPGTITLEKNPMTLYTDTAIIPKQRLPYEGMPNAIINKPQPDSYVGNNGKGSDIYKSHLDNMPVLKPDKSFSSNMSTGNYQLLPDIPVVKPADPAYRYPKK